MVCTACLAMSNAPAVYILAIQQIATSMNTKQCLHAATVALASTLSLMNPVAAEPKQQIYGKDQTSPFEAGWPLRTNPPNRLGAFDGRGIEALYGKKPVWMEPATNGAPMQSAVVSFGFRHDPADLMKRYPIMAMALGKDGKLVFERYQFGTSKSSTFDSQSIAKFLTGLTVGALIQKGTAVDLDTKMLSHVRGLEKSPIGMATVRQTLQMQCGHQFKWADDGTSEGSAGQTGDPKNVLRSPHRGG